MTPQNLSALGLILIIVGIIITFIAAILAGVPRRSDGREKVKTGGIILIGPFPIIFGSDRKTVKVMVYIALAIVVSILILTIVPLLLPHPGGHISV